MATKNDGVSCFDKAAPDEPVFVLRAQDELAPSAIRYWISRVKATGAPMPPEKLAEAEAVARDMEKWPGRKLPT